MLTQDRLKSFVLRRGRITSNQKKAIEDLWDKFILNEDNVLDNSWSKGHSALDIGFGSGETTIHLAKENPGMSILGAEVYLSGIGSLLSKANEKALDNIKILNADIVPFLNDKVKDNSFDIILMFYPDPWPKRKHHKRRLLQKDFINLVNQKLRPEGIFYFKTDWSPYFTEAKKLLLNNQHWQLLRKEDLGSTLKNLPQTSFEKKALSAERELNELILKKLI